MSKDDTLCPKCSHYATCDRPCIHVERQAAKAGGKRLFEKEKLHDGDHITVIYPDRHERHFSGLETGELKHPNGFATEEEHREFWGSVGVQTKTTGIFLDRLINGWSFLDLATKYDVTESTARFLYGHAKKRFLEVAEVMDRKSPRRIAQMNRVSGELPLKVRAYLLAKCFDLTAKEVAEIMGKELSNVAAWIRSCAARVRDLKPVLVCESPQIKGRGATGWEARRRVDH